MKRIDWINIAKGIGILLVVFGHAVQGVSDSENLIASHPILIMKNVIYGFHMPLFVFISGMLFKKSLDIPSFLELIKKKYSIVKIYFIWTIITGTCMALASRLTNNGLGFIEILESPIKPFSEYWYLYNLFFLMILSWALHKFLNNKIVLFLAIILFFLQPFIPNVWTLQNLAEYFIYFETGLILKEFLMKDEKRNDKQALLKVAMTILLFTLVTWFRIVLIINDSNLFVTKLLTGLIGISLVYYISVLIDRRFDVIKRMLIFFGKNSLVLYVAHLVPMAASRIIMIKILHLSNLYIIVAVITLVSILLCTILCIDPLKSKLRFLF